MPQNDRTPAAGTARALRNDCLAAVTLRDIAPPHEIQAARLSRRLRISPALAGVMAELVYGSADTWRGRA